MDYQTIIALARGSLFCIIGSATVDALLKCAEDMNIAAWATSGDGIHYTIGIAA